jgi:rod shape-determining protein MreB
LKDPVKRILDVIKDALEATPAELSSDIIDRGIVLAGGGSQLRGLDQVLREKTGVPVNVADEPHLAIVKGCGAVIEDLEKFKHVLL